MSDRHDDGDRAGGGSASDPDLADRLKHLSARIEARRGQEKVGAQQGTSSGKGDWSQALKMSSEFIGGIIVGGGIGWMLDWLFGISPFGLIIFVMLGFAAGVLNVLRASGALPARGPGPKDPGSGS